MSETGLPTHERIGLEASLKFCASFVSSTWAIRQIESAGRKLIEVAEHAGAEDAFAETKISRLIGIDRHATRWSVVMVVEHLSMFNRDVAQIIRSLQQELVPRGEIQMLDYSPGNNVTWDSVEEYRKGLNELSWLIAGDPTSATSAAFPHPWFGPLTAHQWLCSAALHQRLHLRQARKIVAVLGVT